MIGSGRLRISDSGPKSTKNRRAELQRSHLLVDVQRYRPKMLASACPVLLSIPNMRILSRSRISYMKYFILAYRLRTCCLAHAALTRRVQLAWPVNQSSSSERARGDEDRVVTTSTGEREVRIMEVMHAYRTAHSRLKIQSKGSLHCDGYSIDSGRINRRYDAVSRSAP